MGRNSKARRDARRRTAPPTGAPGARPTPPSDAALALGLVLAAVSSAALAGATSASQARPHVSVLLRRAHPIPLTELAEALAARIDELVGVCLESGWTVHDLEQVVVNLVGRGEVRRVTQAVARAAGGRPRPDLDLLHLDGFTAAFRVAVAIGGLPPLSSVCPPIAGQAWRAAEPVDEELARRLATVRGLLAKAESTDFPEEADAFTAKAQELISRYALESLLGSGDADGDDLAIETRRIWLNPPYADSKLTLVSEVARANRCEAVGFKRLGVVSIVGSPSDLAYVELLVTSLLVQATRAMTAHGSSTNAWGGSSTRSFRSSFLLAFAIRIGDRLREATAAVVDGHDDDRLLPVLRDHEERVRETFESLFTNLRHTTSRRSIDPAGWDAGHVAADLAQLDVHTPVRGADTA